MLTTLLMGLALAAPAQAGSSPLLAMFDANRDGKVSLAEYQAYMDRGFLRMDRNHDKILQPSEYPSGTGRHAPLTLARHHRNVRAQFKRQDSNHDGWLSLAELLRPPR